MKLKFEIMPQNVKDELSARQEKEREKERDQFIKYKIIKDFIKKYPNDAVLGNKIRNYFLKLKLKKL